MILFTYNGWNRRQHFSCWWLYFGFFMCPCYSRRTHYPTLEKPGAQNIAAYQNQGKLRELNDHWKSSKTLFLKKNNNGMAQTRLKDWLGYKF